MTAKFYTREAFEKMGLLVTEYYRREGENHITTYFFENPKFGLNEKG